MKNFTLIVLVISLVVILSFNSSLSSQITNDSLFSSQWGHSNTGQKIGYDNGTQGIDADILKAWDITKGSSSVIVGILDTGIEMNHEDLSGIFYTNPGEIASNGVDDDKNGYVDDVNGWDFVNDDNTVFDNATDDSHGTALAGVIAAAGNNGKGICGVAPNVKILPLKFRNGLMLTSQSYNYAIEAIGYAKAIGVSIINCSFTIYNMPELRDAIEKSGILFICAPGNSSRSLDDTPAYPCSYDLPNVLGVASINCKGQLSNFSAFGTSVQLAAPGENILCTRPGNQYNFSSGTSLSVPYVTGVAALIKSYKPNLGAIEIAEIIKASVKPLNSLDGKVGTGGMLDAYNALKYSEKDIFSQGGIEIVQLGSKGTNDWFRTDVTVTMKPTNSNTSIILYSYDRQDWQKYNKPFSITDEGKTSFFYCLADVNGNKGKIEKKEINIDKTLPTIEVDSPKDGDSFILGSKIPLEYFVKDELSGVNDKNTKIVNSSTIPASKAGVNILRLTAEDNAGNLTALNIKYNVVYNYSGPLEPKEGTILKCGSPLLVKFRLNNAGGAAVENAKGKLFTAFVNSGTAAKEIAAKSAVSTNTSNSFQYNKALKQYTYSLSTKGFKPGKWRLRIELDDGTSKYVNVVLK